MVSPGCCLSRMEINSLIFRLTSIHNLTEPPWNWDFSLCTNQMSLATKKTGQICKLFQGHLFPSSLFSAICAMLPWWGLIVNKDKGTSNSRYPNGQAQAPDCSKCWISVQAFLKQFGSVWSDMVINKHSSHTHLLFKLSVCMVQPIRMFWTADKCKGCKKYIFWSMSHAKLPFEVCHHIW